MIENSAHFGFLLLAIIAVVRREKVGLAATILFYTVLIPMLQASGEIPWRMELRFVTVLVLILLFSRRLRSIPIRFSVSPVLVATLAWFGVTSFYATDTKEALLRTFSFLALYLLCLEWSTPSAFAEVMKAYERTALMIVVASGIIALFDPHLALHGTGRFQGCLHNPNDLGTTLWIVSAMSLSALAVGCRGIRRLFHLLIIGVALLLLNLTASRASIGALAAVWLLAAALSRRRRTFVAFGICLAVIGVGALLWTAESTGWLDLMRLSEQHRGNDLTSGRDREHERAIRLFHEHPIVGLGLGNVAADMVAKQYEIRAVAQLGYHLILVETGLPGLLLLLCPFITVLFRATKRTTTNVDGRRLTAVLIICGYLVNCVGESYLASAMVYPTVLAWIACAHLRRYHAPQAAPVRVQVRQVLQYGTLCKTQG